MSQLKTALAAGHRLIWLTTKEHYRAINTVANNYDGPTYYFGVPNGLAVYQDNNWVTVLVDADPNEDDDKPQTVPIVDFDEALQYVYKTGGAFCIPNIHKQLDAFLSFLTTHALEWGNLYDQDDRHANRLSFVLLSHHDDPPAELASSLTHVELKLPSPQELDTAIDRIVVRTNSDALSVNDKAALVRASRGLSEAEFISAATQCLVENRKLDPEYINKVKVRTLAKDGILKIRVPKVTMEDVGGLDNAKEILNIAAWMWRHPDFCQKRGVKPLSRLVLCGVSGSGKSLICEAAASALSLDLAEFSVGQAMNKYIGESEANMRNAFRQIEALRPVVLWTDELGRDLSGSNSSAISDGGTTSRVHGTFLTGLQELPDEVFWVAAANSLEDLPPEMLRSGRIDKLLFVGYPTTAERQEILKIHLGEFSDGIDIEVLAQRTRLFTGAEIQTLITETRFFVIGKYHRDPTTQDYLDQIPKQKNRVWNLHRPAIIEMYKRAIKEWSWASSAQEADAQMVLEAAKKKTTVTKPTPTSSVH